MTLFDQVRELFTPYFESPAEAERFLNRQCKSHLGIDPQQLGPHDLWNLGKWVEISGALLIGMPRASELKARILDLRKSMGAVPLRDRFGESNSSL